MLLCKPQTYFNNKSYVQGTHRPPVVFLQAHVSFCQSCVWCSGPKERRVIHYTLLSTRVRLPGHNHRLCVCLHRGSWRKREAGGGKWNRRVRGEKGTRVHWDAVIQIKVCFFWLIKVRVSYSKTWSRLWELPRRFKQDKADVTAATWTHTSCSQLVAGAVWSTINKEQSSINAGVLAITTQLISFPVFTGKDNCLTWIIHSIS